MAFSRSLAGSFLEQAARLEEGLSPFSSRQGGSRINEGLASSSSSSSHHQTTQRNTSQGGSSSLMMNNAGLYKGALKRVVVEYVDADGEDGSAVYAPTSNSNGTNTSTTTEHHQSHQSTPTSAVSAAATAAAYAAAAAHGARHHTSEAAALSAASAAASITFAAASPRSSSSATTGVGASSSFSRGGGGGGGGRDLSDTLFGFASPSVPVEVIVTTRHQQQQQDGRGASSPHGAGAAGTLELGEDVDDEENDDNDDDEEEEEEEEEDGRGDTSRTKTSSNSNTSSTRNRRQEQQQQKRQDSRPVQQKEMARLLDALLQSPAAKAFLVAQQPDLRNVIDRMPRENLGKLVQKLDSASGAVGKSAATTIGMSKRTATTASTTTTVIESDIVDIVKRRFMESEKKETGITATTPQNDATTSSNNIMSGDKSNISDENDSDVEITEASELIVVTTTTTTEREGDDQEKDDEEEEEQNNNNEDKTNAAAALARLDAVISGALSSIGNKYNQLVSSPSAVSPSGTARSPHTTNNNNNNNNEDDSNSENTNSSLTASFAATVEIPASPSRIPRYVGHQRRNIRHPEQQESNDDDDMLLPSLNENDTEQQQDGGKEVVEQQEEEEEDVVPRDSLPTAPQVQPLPHAASVSLSISAALRERSAVVREMNRQRIWAQALGETVVDSIVYDSFSTNNNNTAITTTNNSNNTFSNAARSETSNSSSSSSTSPSFALRKAELDALAKRALQALESAETILHSNASSSSDTIAHSNSANKSHHTFQNNTSDVHVSSAADTTNNQQKINNDSHTSNSNNDMTLELRSKAAQRRFDAWKASKEGNNSASSNTLADNSRASGNDTSALTSSSSSSSSSSSYQKSHASAPSTAAAEETKALLQALGKFDIKTLMPEPSETTRNHISLGRRLTAASSAASTISSTMRASSPSSYKYSNTPATTEGNANTYNNSNSNNSSMSGLISQARFTIQDNMPLSPLPPSSSSTNLVSTTYTNIPGTQTRTSPSRKQLPGRAVGCSTSSSSSSLLLMNDLGMSMTSATPTFYSDINAGTDQGASNASSSSLSRGMRSSPSGPIIPMYTVSAARMQPVMSLADAALAAADQVMVYQAQDFAQEAIPSPATMRSLPPPPLRAVFSFPSSLSPPPTATATATAAAAADVSSLESPRKDDDELQQEPQVSTATATVPVVPGNPAATSTSLAPGLVLGPTGRPMLARAPPSSSSSSTSFVPPPVSLRPVYFPSIDGSDVAEEAREANTSSTTNTNNATEAPEVAASSTKEDISSSSSLTSPSSRTISEPASLPAASAPRFQIPLPAPPLLDPGMGSMLPKEKPLRSARAMERAYATLSLPFSASFSTPSSSEVIYSKTSGPATTTTTSSGKNYLTSATPSASDRTPASSVFSAAEAALHLSSASSPHRTPASLLPPFTPSAHAYGSLGYSTITTATNSNPSSSSSSGAFYTSPSKAAASGGTFTSGTGMMAAGLSRIMAPMGAYASLYAAVSSPGAHRTTLAPSALFKSY